MRPPLSREIRGQGWRDRWREQDVAQLEQLRERLTEWESNAAARKKCAFDALEQDLGELHPTIEGSQWPSSRELGRSVRKEDSVLALPKVLGWRPADGLGAVEQADPRGSRIPRVTSTRAADAEEGALALAAAPRPPGFTSPFRQLQSEDLLSRVAHLESQLSESRKWSAASTEAMENDNWGRERSPSAASTPL